MNLTMSIKRYSLIVLPLGLALFILIGLGWIVQTAAATPLPVMNAIAVTNASDLVAYWALDEGTGTVAGDSSGNGYDGTFVDNPTWVTETAPTTFANPYALSFDGANDYVDTTAVIELGQQDFSIGLWLKTTENRLGLIAKSDSDTSWEAGEKNFYLNNLGYPMFVGFGNGYINSETAVNDGAWHHVMVTWDYTDGGGSGAMYVDGVDVTTTSTYTATHNDNGSDTLKLGVDNNNESSNYFAGTMDDVRLYSRALSAAEVASLATGMIGFACTTEYTGDGITDFASNDATAVQSAVDAASSGDMVKVAGNCTGVQAIAGVTQTVYISKNLTLSGGYTYTNWLLADPDIYTTILDAASGGRVAYVTNSNVVTMTDLILTGGSVSNGHGGGIYLDASTLTLARTQVLANTGASHGGGIANLGGTLTVSESTFEGNEADGGRGGGIYNDSGVADIDSSTFYSNTANNGGALYNRVNSFVTVLNSTLSHNQATGGLGGGIHHGGSSSTLDIFHSTLVSNTAATAAGGIYRQSGTIRLYSSIVAHNNSNDCQGGVTDRKYNLDSDGSCGLNNTGSLSNSDPLLFPIADNGGETKTHALKSDSPAIDTIPNGTNGCGTTYTSDQRGIISRPQNSNCDMGAYEANNLIAIDDSYGTDEDIPLIVSAGSGLLSNDISGISLTAAINISPSNGIVNLQTDGGFTYTPTADFNGVDTFTYIADDGFLTETAVVTITVNAINDSLVAVDDTANTTQDRSIMVDVLANDDDVDGDAAITSVGDPLSGTAVISGTAVWYTPPISIAGDIDTFTYTISDGTYSSTAAVTITIYFEVINSNPAHQALNVDATQPIMITFNDAVDATTISTDTIGLHGNMGGYTWTYQVDGALLTMTPTTSFYPGEQVWVSAGDGVEDMQNGPLYPTQIQFTVQTTATRVCENSFTSIGAGLTGVQWGSTAWGDYDNDGDLDILLTGDSSSGRVNYVYRNDGSGSFTELDVGLTDVRDSSIAWGDYDNDGDLDILLTGDSSSGNVSRVYRNDGGGSFTDVSAGLKNVQRGSVAWGDYDNDGDLDILLTGGGNSKVYRNDGSDTFTDINAGRVASIENVTQTVVVASKGMLLSKLY